MHKTIKPFLHAVLLGASLWIAAASVHATLTPEQQKKEFDALFEKWASPPETCQSPSYAKPASSWDEVEIAMNRAKEYEYCMGKLSNYLLNARTSAERFVAPVFWDKLSEQQRTALNDLLKRATGIAVESIGQKRRENERALSKFTVAYREQAGGALNKCLQSAEAHLANSDELNALDTNCPQLKQATSEIRDICRSGRYPKYCAFRPHKSR